MCLKSFRTTETKLVEEFTKQNYQYFVHRQTHGPTDQQVDSSVPPKTFILQGYNERRVAQKNQIVMVANWLKRTHAKEP